MKKAMYILAICITVPCILLALLYLAALTVSPYIALPFAVEPNVLFTDWFFLALPVLALLMSIFLQIATLRRKAKKTK